MADSKKILILGGSSYVGRHLFARLSPDRAVATYNKTPLEHGVFFDSLSMRLTDILDAPEEISHAVVLLGDTNPETCAADVTKSNALNVHSIQSLMDDLVRWRIKPVFTSSEFVFDGTKGNYLETDPVNPILLYGRQKVEIENYLQKFCDDYVVVRLAKVFGSRRGDKTIFTGWLDAIEQRKTIYCAHDQIFSPVYVEDVVEGIIRLVEHDCSGIFHLAGPKPFRRIELLEILLGYVKERSSLDITVVPCSIHDFNLREKRPLDVSLKPDKLVGATGLRLSDVASVCKNIVRESFITSESDRSWT